MSEHVKVLPALADNDICRKLFELYMDEVSEALPKWSYNDGLMLEIHSGDVGRERDFEDVVRSKLDSYSHLIYSKAGVSSFVKTPSFRFFSVQLLFACMKTGSKIPLMFYMGYLTGNPHAELRNKIREQIEKAIPNLKAEAPTFFTVGSPCGVHLPFHTDKFSTRYHQVVDRADFGEPVLEFIDGSRFFVETGKSYQILSPGEPHSATYNGALDRTNDKPRVLLTQAIL